MNEQIKPIGDGPTRRPGEGRASREARGPTLRPRVSLPVECDLRLAADLVDHAVGEVDDIEVAVGSLLDICCRPETRADLEGLALRAVELGRPEDVVGDAVG